MYTDSANAFQKVYCTVNKSRCIDVRFKWVGEMVKRQGIELVNIPGTEMVADGLTKALNHTNHTKFVKMLGMIEG